MTQNEIDAYVATLPESGPKGEVTPEMVEAGFRVLAASGIADETLEWEELLVVEIYLAMRRLSSLSSASSGQEQS